MDVSVRYYKGVTGLRRMRYSIQLAQSTKYEGCFLCACLPPFMLGAGLLLSVCSLIVPSTYRVSILAPCFMCVHSSFLFETEFSVSLGEFLEKSGVKSW